jgi:uncharacterized damage-inducible protein DinB
MSDRKFPIGPFVLQENYSDGELGELLRIIRESPSQYRDAVEHLSGPDLSKTYREGSWNVRQLVHHVADIALLHYFRMKKALTEPGYEITLIEIDAWASTPDVLKEPVSTSLAMFDAIHQRYAAFAEVLDEEQLAVSYFHPVRKIQINQTQALAMSAWHVQHHLAHIRLALS